MNHGKHVTPEEVSSSANLLTKYFQGKIKASTLVVFSLNLIAVSV
jgi:hypothetical protein